MSATLVAKGLAAGHGDRLLFAGLDLVVGPGDVAGLVGANGAGSARNHQGTRSAHRIAAPGT
jgi:ATPase subunit of ABC transporter with duplicated ATPase domains